MNKDELFNVPEEQQIMTQEEREKHLMQYFAVDNFINRLFNKKLFIEYLKELYKYKIPTCDIVDLIKKIDNLSIGSLGSMYVTEQQDGSIIVYFYQDDTNYIIGTKYGI